MYMNFIVTKSKHFISIQKVILKEFIYFTLLFLNALLLIFIFYSRVQVRKKQTFCSVSTEGTGSSQLTSKNNLIYF